MLYRLSYNNRRCTYGIYLTAVPSSYSCSTATNNCKQKQRENSPPPKKKN